MRLLILPVCIALSCAPASVDVLGAQDAPPGDDVVDVLTAAGSDVRPPDDAFVSAEATAPPADAVVARDSPDVVAARDAPTAAVDVLCPGIGVEPGVAFCDGTCVYTHSNAAHCGGCNRPCEGARLGLTSGIAASRCVDSQCRYECVHGRGNCDPRAVCATNLLTDPLHCGACGSRCAPAVPICRGGRCSAR